MYITTSSGQNYSYLRQSGEIVSGIIEDDKKEWVYDSFSSFSSMPYVDHYVIGVTEQCNLRCTYCCYSGSYANSRKHSNKRMSESDIDKVYSFIEKQSPNRPLYITFYGGEALMNLAVVRYAVGKGKEMWGNNVLFSISSNGVLLTEKMLDWIVKENISLDLSLDGPAEIHDRQRIDQYSRGSFDKVHHSLHYLKANYPNYLSQHVRLLMTLVSRNDIIDIARMWNEDDLLQDIAPSKISGLSPNFAKGFDLVEYEEVKSFYQMLLQTYIEHPNWVVLKKYLMQCVDDWKTRPILDADKTMPLSTCLPLNTKLYIDTDGQIAVCEKIADKYRIGDVHNGIDWERANALALEYYNLRNGRCNHCEAVRMCYQCLTNVEFNNEQWEMLCHNDRVYTKVYLWLFCEMAERGLIEC